MKISESNIQIFLIGNTEGLVRKQRIFVFVKVSLIGRRKYEICWVLSKLGVLPRKGVCLHNSHFPRPQCIVKGMFPYYTSVHLVFIQIQDSASLKCG